MNKFWQITLATLLGFSIIQSAEIPAFLNQSNSEIAVLLKIKPLTGHSFDASVAAKTVSPSIKHNYIIAGLKNDAYNSQCDIISQIIDNGITDYKSYWISNFIYIKAPADIIRDLAARPEVESVIENTPLMLVTPVDSSLATDSQLGAEPGLDVIGAHQAWAMGLTGEGTLVCNFDTGVKGTHPALMNKWRGNNGGSSRACWFDPFTNTTYPDDVNGHGTHTMGTMVGMVGGDTVGVAFGAQWIAAAVVDRGAGVQRTIADILSAFQWAADPDSNPATSDDMPDVINNSWGVPTGFFGPCDNTFWDAIDNLEALGIVCLFAAGNEGPAVGSIRTPSDRISSQFNSFAVGAINGLNLEIASFSSRGPSGCDSITVKPELVAPGVSVRSCNTSGSYRSMSGTSMATPHVAGTVALLRQYNPEATVNQIKQALIEGAIDLGPVGEDNNYGHGMLNIVNSLRHMPPPSHPFVYLRSISLNGRDDSLAQPGSTIDLVINIENIGGDGNITIRLVNVPPGIDQITGEFTLTNVGHLDTISNSIIRIRLDDNLIPGTPISLTIEFASEAFSQRYYYTIVVDGSADPAVATMATENIQLSFSNFGQFGLGPNSVNPQSGAVGFRYPADGNDIMKEASLLIAADGVVSDGVRNLSGISDNDFQPISTGAPRVIEPGVLADIDGYASYTDSAAENPIGLRISQKSFGWNNGSKFIDIEFTITNISGSPLNNLRVGLYCDWNLSDSFTTADIAGYNDILSLGYIQDSQTGWCAGIRPLNMAASSYRVINARTEIVSGLSDSTKASYMDAGFIYISSLNPSDYSHLISVGPFNIAAGDSEVVAFAFVAGESLQELCDQAYQAFRIYPGIVNPINESPAPVDYSLSQNYPNPFNSSTIIDFNSKAATDLIIYDITGRLVKSFDIVSAGPASVVWDGSNQKGEKVSTGVYFYRLNNQPLSDTKKMTLIK